MGKTGKLLWPNIIHGENFGSMLASPFVSNDSSLYFVFQQQESTTINEILLSTTNFTGTSGTSFYSVGIQGVGVTGYPNGVFLNSGSAFSTVNYAYQGVTKYAMPSGTALTGGEFYSIVVSGVSGLSTFNYFSIFYEMTGMYSNVSMPYHISNNEKKTTNTIPIFGLRSSNKTYGNLIYDFSNYNTVFLRSNTTPDEIGVKWSLDKSWGNHYYISGVKLFYLTPSLTNGNYSADMIIYDSDGSTILQSTTIWLEQRGENASPKSGQRIAEDLGVIYFQGNLAKLSYGKEYYFSFRPNDILNGVTFYTFYPINFSNKEDKELYTSSKMNYIERTNNGAWTEVSTRALKIQFIIETSTKNSKIYFSD